MQTDTTRKTASGILQRQVMRNLTYRRKIINLGPTKDSATLNEM